MKIWNKKTPLWVKLKIWWQLNRKIPWHEFHPCLDNDHEAMYYHMCDCARRRYVVAIATRRQQAHKRDLEGGEK